MWNWDFHNPMSCRTHEGKSSNFVKNISDVRAYNNDDKALTSAKINNNTFISCEEGAYFELGDNMTATVEGNIFAGTKAYISKSLYKQKRLRDKAADLYKQPVGM